MAYSPTTFIRGTVISSAFLNGIQASLIGTQNTGRGASLSLFSDIATATWGFQGSTPPNYIVTSGYSALGIGGAVYYLLPPGVYTPTVYRNQDADGNWWSLDTNQFVYPEQLGAKGDGTTDDSAAFALACGGTFRSVVLRSGANYVAGDISVFNGVSIEGTTGRDYTGIHSYILPRITRKAGCAVVFLVDQHGNAAIGRAVTMRNFAINGIDQTCHGISAGSVRLNIRDVYITNCNFGIGGGASGGWAYSNTMDARCVLVTNCIRGISSPIDSRFIGCELANNGDNLRAVAGANSNQFIGGRIEFASTGNNIRLDASGSGSTISYWRFIGVEIDRGFGSAANLNTATYISFIGCMFRRAASSGGVQGGLGVRSMVYTDGCDNITVTDPQSSHGHNDSGDPAGPGLESPSYFWEFNGINSNCALTGGSIINSYVLAAMHYNSGLNTTQMPNHKITGVVGVEDYDNSSFRWKDTGREFYGKSVHAGVLTAAGGNATITGLTVPGPSGNDARGYTLKVWTRNTASSLRNLSCEIPFEVRKDAGTATIIMPAFGSKEMGTKGAIGVGSTTATTGTAQAGGTTLICRLNAGASGTDDAYLGWSFTATGGTNSGYTGVCIGYNGTTKDLHLHKPAAAAFDNTTTFSMRAGSQIQIATANPTQTGDGPFSFDITFTNSGASDSQDVWAEIGQ